MALVAPQEILTSRLVLRRPDISDAAEVFQTYASDPRVGEYLGWPLHRSLDDTIAFLSFCDQEWERWPAGPYLIYSQDDGALLGSTGLSFVTPVSASTGFVVAASEWGKGIATEAATEMRRLAASLNLMRLFAICHPNHRASQRVLEKVGFTRDQTRVRIEFPNLESAVQQEALCYACNPSADA